MKDTNDHRWDPGEESLQSKRDFEEESVLFNDITICYKIPLLINDPLIIVISII
jgi:hypothetical protein